MLTVTKCTFLGQYLLFFSCKFIVKIKNSLLTVNCNNIQLNPTNTYVYMCFEPLPQAGGGGEYNVVLDL